MPVNRGAKMATGSIENKGLNGKGSRAGFSGI